MVQSSRALKPAEDGTLISHFLNTRLVKHLTSNTSQIKAIVA
jgi:hypothetical protein